MTPKEEQLKMFFEVLQQEQQARNRQLLDAPEIEEKRLERIEFRRVIETVWVPILHEHLRVLGKLWFGSETRLKGSEWRKELASFPSYTVSHQIFGLMAVFSVEAASWSEREMSFANHKGARSRTQEYKEGYRCQCVMAEDGQYQLLESSQRILAQFKDGTQVEQKLFADIFAEAYLRGPRIILFRWKNM